ncbi:recombination regulator RecX [Caballeronia sp. LZ024]|nr:recombination regulator RecX [Caballeronia sp. LZ024]
MRKSRFGSKVGSGKGRADDRVPGGSNDDSSVSRIVAEGGDHYERSSERRGDRAGASTGKRGWGRKPERAGVEQSTSARRVSAAGFSGDEATEAAQFAGITDSVSPTDRIERARVLLAQTLEKPKSLPQPTANAPPDRAKNRAHASAPALSDPFEDADPFEPFEQCVPDSASLAQRDEAESGETVYSRSSQTRRRQSDEKKASKRPQRSLKGRALAYLSRREHSRAELSRKLVPFVHEADSLEGVLDALEREGWLSNARFVESVVHRRSGSFGSSRIVSELKRHNVGEELISETGDELSRTELARAHAVWTRKYGTPPQTPAERAKQSRFLAARGFSGSTISKVIKGGDEDLPFDPADD